MGHKRLLPVDVVMQMLKFSPYRAEHYSSKSLKMKRETLPTLRDGE
jgi:hypothetical protein